MAASAGERTEQSGDDGRDESPAERLDRNWGDILQELRVIQTGTQILTGFLLTIAFAQRFEDLVDYQVALYLGLVVTAAIATVLGLAPVALHRWLWGRHLKKEVVVTADVLLKLTLVAVALTLAGTVLLIFDLVVNLTIGIIVAAVALLAAAAFWVMLPVWTGRRRLG